MRIWLLALLLTWSFGATAGREEQRVPLTLPSGQSLELRLLWPASRDPLPAVVLLGGFERGETAIDLLDPGVPAVFAGFAYPAELPRRPGWRDIRPALQEFERGIADTHAALGAVRDWLAEHPRVDAQRLVLVGASAGAPFALMAAADFNYPNLVLVHGFVQVPQVIGRLFQRSWQDRLGIFAGPLAWLAARLIVTWVEVPRPEAFAPLLRPQQSVLVLDSAADDLIPAEAVAAQLAVLRASEADVSHQIIGDQHLRGEDRPMIRELLDASMRWLRGRGVL
jgi:dienelactone hydrolase